jgi:hypothetical protein
LQITSVTPMEDPRPSGYDQNLKRSTLRPKNSLVGAHSENGSTTKAYFRKA